MPEFAEIGRHLQGGGFWPDMGLVPEIGIGGLHEEAPLPHHPACGSAPGGSRA